MCCGIDHWKDYHNHGSYAANGSYAVKAGENTTPRLNLARRLAERRGASLGESALEQIAQPFEQAKSAADLFAALKPETKIYKIVNNRIVGEIAVTELNGNPYYQGASGEQHYTSQEDRFPQHSLRTEPIDTRQSNLLALIERARKEQSAPWQS